MGEGIGIGVKGPFDELVVDPRDTGGRFVAGVLEAEGYFFVVDQYPSSPLEGSWIIDRDCGEVNVIGFVGEEPVA